MFSEDEFVLARLKNTTKSAEGSNLPPQLSAGIRVPLVTGLKINRTTLFNTNTSIQYILTWNNAIGSNIDHYNIYISNSSDPKGTITSPLIIKNSPAYILVPVSPNANSKNIITLQTVLSNGLMSPINNSCSVVGGLINFP